MSGVGGISSFPGVNPGFDVDEAIEKLVEAKKARGKKYITEKKDTEIKRKILRDFNKELMTLRELAKSLYDYRSPFRDFVAHSDDESVVSAVADRRASEGVHRVKVLQLASPDIFSSDPIPIRRKLSAGRFLVKLGNKKAEVDFKGGSLETLAKMISKYAGDLVDAYTVKDTPETEVMVIKGKKSGKDNRLSFDGNIEPLLEAGVLRRGSEGEKVVRLSPYDAVGGRVSGDSVVVADGSGASWKVNEFPADEKTKLKFKLNLMKKEQTIADFPIGEMEPVKIESVEVKGSKLITDTSEKPKSPVVEVKVKLSGGIEKIYRVDRSGEVNITMSDLKGKIESVEFNVSGGDAVVSDVSLARKEEKGGLVPANVISRAKDSKVVIDGIEIDRPSNEISDAVKGVTFKLKKESSREVRVSIEHDLERVKEHIISFIQKYNEIMEKLDVLTKPNLDRRPLSEKPEEEREKGVFQTMFAVNSLKMKLRNLAMRPYSTRLGRKLSMLAQIGIFTRKAGHISFDSEDWKSSRKGILNIDTDQLDEALKKNFYGVMDLFARDTDGNRIYDTGFAVEVDKVLSHITGRAGIIAREIRNMDNKIEQLNETIDRFNEDVEDYRQTLIRKFSRMNESLMEMKKRSSWLDAQMKGLNSSSGNK